MKTLIAATLLGLTLNVAALTCDEVKSVAEENGTFLFNGQLVASDIYSCPAGEEASGAHVLTDSGLCNVYACYDNGNHAN